MEPIKTILVPYDFTEQADAALAVAARFAELFGAQLQLVHVLRPPAYSYEFQASSIANLHRDVENELAAVAAALPTALGPVAVHVMEGTRIADAVDTRADEIGADLIVIGTHGRTGLAHMLHGSVAERTLRHAPCSVLVVPKRDSRPEAVPVEVSSAAEFQTP